MYKHHKIVKYLRWFALPGYWHLGTTACACCSTPTQYCNILQCKHPCMHLEFSIREQHHSSHPQHQLHPCRATHSAPCGPCPCTGPLYACWQLLLCLFHKIAVVQPVAACILQCALLHTALGAQQEAATQRCNAPVNTPCAAWHTLAEL